MRLSSSLGLLGILTVLPESRFNLRAVSGALEPPAVKAEWIASPESGWPQCRGPRRDAICTETGLLGTWPEAGPPLLWKQGDLGRGYSAKICYDVRRRESANAAAQSGEFPVVIPD